MIYRILRSFKNLIFKNLFLTMIVSKFYKIANNLFLNNNIDIYNEDNNWIHKTSLGLIPSDKPIFNPENYVKKNFEIMFENYLPKKNDVVVELGAGQGCETLYISKIIGENGKLISVEPFEKIFKILNKTIKINNLQNVTAIQKAIYNDSSKIGFTSSIDSWLGGKIDNNSKNLVTTCSLDDLVIDENLNQINFCKINIEGAEKYILEKSNKFFDICENLVIECHDFLEEEEYKTFDMIKKFLISKKYHIKFSNRNKFSYDKFYVYASK